MRANDLYAHFAPLDPTKWFYLVGSSGVKWALQELSDYIPNRESIVQAFAVNPFMRSAHWDIRDKTCTGPPTTGPKCTLLASVLPLVSQ